MYKVIINGNEIEFEDDEACIPFGGMFHVIKVFDMRVIQDGPQVFWSAGSRSPTIGHQSNILEINIKGEGKKAFSECFVPDNKPKKRKPRKKKPKLKEPNFNQFNDINF